MVIFDRYTYDIGLDPKRFRISLNVKFINWVINFVPKPNLTICLYGDPDVIFNRKKELPYNEVVRQTESIKSFAYRRENTIMVDTSEHNINQVRNVILQEIIKIYTDSDE